MADAFVNDDPFNAFHGVIAAAGGFHCRDPCAHFVQPDTVAALCHAAFFVLLAAAARAQIVSADFLRRRDLRLSLSRQMSFPAVAINGLQF